MRIGIDISQIVYEGAGVSELLKHLVINLLFSDKKNSYVFFAGSLRKQEKFREFAKSIETTDANKKISLKIFPFPPTLLDFLWNKLHIFPIERLIGDVDLFISSDWTQPPTEKAKRVTILYDLLVYKFPHEMHQKIVKTQKRRLEWVKKECDQIICISEATKKDAIEILGIEEKKLQVVYPGGSK